MHDQGMLVGGTLLCTHSNVKSEYRNTQNAD